MSRRIVSFVLLISTLFILLLAAIPQKQSKQAFAASSTLEPAALKALAYGQLIDQEITAKNNLNNDDSTLPMSASRIEAVNQGITGILAYASNRSSLYDIYTQSIIGDQAAAIVHDSGNQATPSWSPDGQHLLYASDQNGNFDIYLYSAAGQVTQLTFHPSEDIHPSWSPDGNHIIFSSNRNGYYQAYTMSVQGGSATQIGNIANNVLWPHFSPDGTQIVFMRASIPLPACDWNWDVWTMDANGNNQTRMTTWIGGDLYPSWSPDGRIVYSSCRNLLTADLYLLDPATAVNTQLTNWPLSTELGSAYSPDGAYLAFHSNISGNNEIYFASSSGDTAIKLTDASGDDLTPSWQPASGQTGSQTIAGILLDTNGDPLTGVAVSAGSQTTLSASDGSFLLTNLAGGLYTVTPNQPGLYFSPVSRIITVPPNQEDLFFIGSTTPCQNSLSGQVSDEQDGSFIEDADVSILGSGIEETVQTNAIGYYEFTGLLSGRYQIRIEKPGYETETSLVVLDGDQVCDVYNPRLTPVLSYLQLAEYYAPVWYQDVDMRNADADFITNFNFDGNWNGVDNWQNQDNSPLKAYIYYTVLETESHWFIHYADFHPRDWGPEVWQVCTGGSISVAQSLFPCHENDMEGVLVAVKKDGTAYGQFHFMETVYHITFLRYSNDPLLIGTIGNVRFFQDTHPLVYMEPIGHGVKAHDNSPFKDGDGVVYYHEAGNPTEPANIAAGQTVTATYDLIPISDDLWNRRFDYLIPDGNQTYQDWGTFAQDEPQIFGGAHPPWGWTDVLELSIQTGDYFFNPAFVSQVHLLGLGSDFSRNYLYNPYCFSEVFVGPDSYVYLLSVDGRIQLIIPPGSVAEEILFTHHNNCRYVQAASQHQNWNLDETNQLSVLVSEGNQVIVGHTFSLEAQTTIDQTPVPTMNQPYEIQFRYTETDVENIFEDSLALYWWDGNAWIMESSFQHDLRKNEIWATLKHLGQFAVMGDEKNKVFLPVILDSP